MNYILKNENAVYYECGFSCDNALFLKLGEEGFFITDSRYTQEAKEYIKGAEVIEGDRRDMFVTLKGILLRSGIKNLVYDPSEWSVYEFNNLKTDEIDLTPEMNLSQKKRIIKDESELKLLKEASKLGAKSFEKFCTFVKERGLGLDERRLHFEAETIFKDEGKLGLSFSPIVALEENSSKPHSLPTCRRLRRGDLILLDGGVMYKRYCSDRTRVSCVDDMSFKKEKTFKDPLKQKIYDTVLLAQEVAIKTAKAGVKAKDIDKAAREVIDKAGFGNYFIHSTGHGVGLDIHELPIIGPRNEEIIKENMVFTVEPGIYIPGKFGVRIEDTVISKNGYAEVIG